MNIVLGDNTVDVLYRYKQFMDVSMADTTLILSRLPNVFYQHTHSGPAVVQKPKETWPSVYDDLVAITKSTHLWKDIDAVLSTDSSIQIQHQIDKIKNIHRYVSHTPIVIWTVSAVRKSQIPSDVSFINMHNVDLSRVDASVPYVDVRRMSESITVTVNDPTYKYNQLYVKVGADYKPIPMTRNDVSSYIYIVSTYGGKSDIYKLPLNDRELNTYNIFKSDDVECNDSEYTRMLANEKRDYELAVRVEETEQRKIDKQRSEEEHRIALEKRRLDVAKAEYNLSSTVATGGSKNTNDAIKLGVTGISAALVLGKVLGVI